MDPTLIVKHASGRYPIYAGAGLLDKAGDLLQRVGSEQSRFVIVTDENVAQYMTRLTDSLSTASGIAESLVHVTVPAGESSKSLSQVESIWNQLLSEKIDRRATIIALGGGVVGDLAGFVAATYMRGINFVQIPTSLLAQVDSSVGGKTGVNMPAAKNSVGAFWQPQAVIIDPSLLKTLEPKEFTSGLAEVVKYGAIMDEQFFEYLETNVHAVNEQDLPTLEKLIVRCCQLKAQVVEEDERETSGRRVILNYGHTFGHAIESVFGYGKFPHGHAVAMGMHAAAILRMQTGRVNKVFVERQSSLLSLLKIPHRFPAEKHEQLFEAMQHDKKAVNGEARFILPTRFGHVELVSSVDRALVLEAMNLACQATE